MTNLDTALDLSKRAVQELIGAGERSQWTSPRAPGKWSPSQIAEHVARSLEESAHMAEGRPSKFPRLPAIIHPVVRMLLFNRVLKHGTFPRAKTNRAMNPQSGPATPSEGRVRLETAHEKFDDACRQTARHSDRLRTTIFGAVPVEDYVRFMELHTRHHCKQIAEN